ncbi:hypothetical protein INT43_006034 [Umbelopsis isabellina]|uniref:GATA-type domain-containing protein n=1 Tax=Mortierella isabellina TaxID=91625 RepID=A0A8H7PJ78_MORIS|nr:hypothetical protein INT43_006034 [Umbelopsis isabellina]
MTGKLCFWAILSNTDLRFIYFSPSLAKLLGIPPNVVPDVLQGRTLWELIHPEEYALAQEDLKKFMDNKHIGGSVTRCRLMDLDNIIEHKVDRRSSIEVDIPVDIQPRPLDKRPSLGNGPNWEVVDIVMYLVTDQLILTFFHADYDSGVPSHTGSLPLICQEVHFTMEDARDLTHLLHSATAEEVPNARPDSTRIFQIMETATQDILLTWPPASDKVRETLQITDEKLTSMLSEGLQRKQKRQKNLKHLHPYEHATCVHQAQVHSHTLFDSGVSKKVESIIVQYGMITFGSFDVSLLHQPVATPPKAISDPLSTIIHNSQSPPMSSSPASLNGLTIQPSLPSPSTTSESRNGTSIREADVTTSKLEEIHTSEPTFRPASNTTVWNANIQLKLGTSSHGNARVVCENCHTDSSPEWRKGPTGQKTLCNACGLRYARSVAKQDSFGRRQRGVRVIVNSNQYEKQAPIPPAIEMDSTFPIQLEAKDELLASSDKDSQQSIEPLAVPEQVDSTSSANMTRRRKKSRYLPIGDNRAGARTRAARKSRSIHSDTTSQH